MANNHNKIWVVYRFSSFENMRLKMSLKRIFKEWQISPFQCLLPTGIIKQDGNTN